MIYVKIIGGLGNQMFQYATSLALAIKNSTTVGIDLSEINKHEGKEHFSYRNFQLEKIFNIKGYKILSKKTSTYLTDQSITARLKKKVSSFRTYHEKGLNYDPNLHTVGQNSFIEGYFQSEKYFNAYREELLKHFSFSLPYSEKSEHISKKIQEVNAIAVHIRRGDYISDQHINSVHGVCSIDYYKNAIIHLKVENPHFFFFSDDMNWVKENFASLDLSQCDFVDWNTGDDSWQDMKLMSQCKHFIIANSSFSWWAAWLSESQNKKVIAPREWYADAKKNNETGDLIPDSWTRL